MALTKGRTICNGKYEVLRLVGEGGQSRVWLAREVKRGLEVAIKEPLPVLSSREREELEDRFQRELRLSARILELDVPNAVRVLTVDEHEGQTLLVMEYCVGGSLAERLQHGPLPVEYAVRVTLEICAALDVVHSRLRLVHRDIKPSNILFARDGHARLGDFGLAQTGESGRSRLSGAGHPGSPGYMSPEQEGQTGYLAPASDLYSLGCVLFEMVTGEQYQRLRPGTPASSLGPEVPACLDAVLAKALQEDPWQRYASAGEMAQALRAGLEERARAQAEASRQAEEGARAKADAKARAAAEHNATQARLEEETRRKEAEARAQAQARARVEEEQRRRVAERQARMRRSRAGAAALLSRWRTWAWIPVAITAVALVVLGAGGRGPLAALFVKATATSFATPSQEPTAAPTDTASLTPSPTPTGTQSPAPTWTPTPTETKTPLPAAVVNQASAELREGPSSVYPLLENCPQGTPLQVLGRSIEGLWLKVQAPGGHVGWMLKKYMEVNLPPERISVAEIPPTPTSVPDGTPTTPRPTLSTSQLLAIGKSMPAWNPDGGKLAFLKWGGGWELWMVDLYGAETHIKSDCGAQAAPVWLPDGRSIIFGGLCRPDKTTEYRWGIYSVDVQTGNLRAITHELVQFWTLDMYLSEDTQSIVLKSPYQGPGWFFADLSSGRISTLNRSVRVYKQDTYPWEISAISP